MSDHSLFHGWRSRTFYLSRDRTFLLRAAFGIVAAGLVIGCALVWLRADKKPRPDAIISAHLMRIQEDYGRLHQATAADTRQLCRWLATLMERTSHVDEHKAGSMDARQLFGIYVEKGRLLDYDVRALLEKHAEPQARALFHDFIQASLLRDKAEGAQSRQKVETQAARDPVPVCANELAASLALQRGEPHAAVSWLLREGMLFTDAEHARTEAVQIALEVEDLESLRRMRAVPGWIESCTPVQQSQAGGLLTDVPLQWKALLMDHFTDIPWLHLAFTLMAGAVWTVILVQHDAKNAWRWARPVLPVIAGVASIWPTVTILSWQEHVQGLVQGGPFPHDLWYFIIGVGAREEVSKLALFSLFLPWLLMTRAPGRALLTGAFVGLGFAIEENVQYYQRAGVSAVLGRLLTANFLHICLTAVASHELYRMFRSRFATAGEFVVTFAIVVFAHGLYDWLAFSNPFDVGGWLAMALFMLIAVRFFELLAQEVEAKRSTVSLRAVFMLGCAVIVALVFILAGIQGGSTAEIADAGASSVSIVPVAILYWRRFEHA